MSPAFKTAATSGSVRRPASACRTVCSRYRRCSSDPGTPGPQSSACRTSRRLPAAAIPGVHARRELVVVLALEIQRLAIGSIGIRERTVARAGPDLVVLRNAVAIGRKDLNARTQHRGSAPRWRIGAGNQIPVEPCAHLAALAGPSVGIRCDVAVVVAVVFAPARLQRRAAIAEEVVDRAETRRVVGPEVDEASLLLDEAGRREAPCRHAAFYMPVSTHCTRRPGFIVRRFIVQLS